MKSIFISISRPGGTPGWLWNFRPGSALRYKPSPRRARSTTRPTNLDSDLNCRLKAYARQSRAPRAPSILDSDTTPSRLRGSQPAAPQPLCQNGPKRTAAPVEPGSSHHLKSDYPPQVKHLSQLTRTSKSLRAIGPGTRSSTAHRDIPGAKGWNVTRGPGVPA